MIGFSVALFIYGAGIKKNRDYISFGMDILFSVQKTHKEGFL
jgi:hypothetical protein